MKLLPEAADKILNKFVLVVTVAWFILLFLSTVLQTPHSVLQGRQPGPV
jgi:preprotein translocase subunit SecG